MGRRFHGGEPGYQTDAKWWELVEEADRQLLGSSTATPGTGASTNSQEGTLEGFAPPDAETVPSTPAPVPTSAPVETPIASLSGEFRSNSTGLRWDVRALDVEATHPALEGASRPWGLSMQANGIHHFFVNTRHAVFASATMTPLDGLLAELSWSAMDFLRGQVTGAATFASVLAELREHYAISTALDPVALATAARQTLISIASSLARNIDAADALALFNALPPHDQDAIFQKMATKRAGNPQSVISAGRFLEFASWRVLLEFFEKHPELFLDGKCWEDAYSDLDYGRPAATEEAQQQVVRYYGSLLTDAVWLAEQDTGDLSQLNRGRLLRAQLSLDLLAPAEPEDGGT